MKFEVYQEKLLQLQQWIKNGSTGPPKELAKRLNVSERTARRLVERLKQEQPNIIFCRKVNSYIEDEQTNRS